MNAQWRRWLIPVAVACALWALALSVKLAWEAQAPLTFIATHAAGQPDELVIPELTMAAAQRAPFGPASQARERLVALAEHDVSARRALMASSSGARAFGRPEVGAVAAHSFQDAIKAADDAFPAPNLWARLLAALMGLAWPGAALAWMVRGYDADGAPMASRWRWAMLTGALFLGWCLTLGMA